MQTSWSTPRNRARDTEASGDTLCRGKQHARDVLVVFLAFIATCESFWFTINGDITNDVSFARRLGFFRDIDYYAFLVSAGLAAYKTTRGVKVTDPTRARD